MSDDAINTTMRLVFPSIFTRFSYDRMRQRLAGHMSFAWGESTICQMTKTDCRTLSSGFRFCRQIIVQLRTAEPVRHFGLLLFGKWALEYANGIVETGNYVRFMGRPPFCDWLYGCSTEKWVFVCSQSAFGNQTEASRMNWQPIATCTQRFCFFFFLPFSLSFLPSSLRIGVFS